MSTGETNLIKLASIIFKLYRRIHTWFRGFRSAVKKKYYSSISGRNFSFHPTVFLGKGFSIESDFSDNRIVLEKGVYFRDDCKVRLENNALVKIAENTFFNRGCSINSIDSIEIGQSCLFGESVKLYDHNHNFKTARKPISEQGYSTGPITIGNNCWIGSNVVILKNVTIGDNVVIGAGCVIHKSVLPGKIVVNKQQLSES